MRFLFLISVTAVSLRSFASDNFTYIDECKSEAIINLTNEAKANNAVLDEQTVSVDSIDDRWYNPSKYVWFSGRAKKADGSVLKLTTMLQKSASSSKKCSAFKKESAPKKVAFVEECKIVAKSKLKDELKNQGAEMDEKTISVDDVDDRWYNPSKYVWFTATGKKSDGQVVSATVMMQKNALSLDRCGARLKQGTSSSEKSSGTNNSAPGIR